jgi:hypothetical protein
LDRFEKDYTDFGLRICRCADMRMIFLGLHGFEKDFLGLHRFEKDYTDFDVRMCKYAEVLIANVQMCGYADDFLGLHSEGVLWTDLKRITPILMCG